MSGHLERDLPAFRDRAALVRALDRWSFGRRTRRPRRADAEALAAAVAASSFQGMFDFDVVGSFPELGDRAKDLDLVVRAKGDGAVSIADIERVLIAVESFGIHQLGISIDTSFRSLSEKEMLARLATGERFPTVKLHAARWDKLEARSPDSVRLLGRYLVEVWRSVDETSYFRKLPRLAPDDPRRTYRPAVPLGACVPAARDESG